MHQRQGYGEGRRRFVCVAVALLVGMSASACTAATARLSRPPPSPSSPSSMSSSPVEPSKAVTEIPVPTESQTPSLSTAPWLPSRLVQPPSTCPTGTESTQYYSVGWLGTRIFVMHDYDIGCDVSMKLGQELLSVDPAVGHWRTDDQWTDSVLESWWASTDDSSIAMPNANGIFVIDAAGKLHFLPRPAGAPQDFGSYGLPVLAVGGYLVAGGDKLYRVASDGSRMTGDPLPIGYVAVAPTSDPNLFILTRAEDANLADGLVGAPFRAYLWDLRTSAIKLVASSVSTVDRSPDSLAYLSGASGWLSLAADGSTKKVSRPAWFGNWNSPDGSRYIHVPDPASTAVQTVELREAGTGRVLASAPVALGTVVWKGSVATMASGSDLVIFDGTTVTRLPMP
jgi:hypothetical protein